MRLKSYTTPKQDQGFTPGVRVRGWERGSREGLPASRARDPRTTNSDKVDQPGRPLDNAVRGFMESAFGHDFSRVRVHTDESAGKSAVGIGASAYTTGADIVFAPGAYAPATDSGRARLAHELTHVVQQTRPRTLSSPDEAAEIEAARNSDRVGSGLSGQVHLGVAQGTVQCQSEDDEKKKVEAEVSQDTGFTLKPDAVKNKFAFAAEVTIPLFPDAKRGPLLFLDQLKIKGEASKETETSLKNPVKLPGASDIDSLQAEAALSLIHLELPKLKGRLGELGLDANLEATSTLQKDFGSGGKFSSKFGGKATVGAEYKSRALGGPAATFFGILGDKATASVGGEGTFSDEIEKNKAPDVKMGAAGMFGLTGTGKNEPFIKFKIGGEGALDPKNGRIDPASKAIIGELSIGFKI